MAKDGVLPANDPYSMLISEFGKASLVSGSLLWIKHMKVCGIFLNEVTMNTILNVLKDAGEFDLADRFYKDWCVGKVDVHSLGVNDMNEFGAESQSKPISLMHFLSTELFKIGGKKSNSDAVVLPEMENVVRKPQLTSTYNSMIDLYGKAGRLTDAVEVFVALLKAGVAPDTSTFSTMIHICGSHGNLTEAEALLNKMEERGVSPDTITYTTLLSLYAKAGNVDATLQWYWKIRKAGLFPDKVTCMVVLNMLCEKQLIQKVETVLSEMEKCNLNVPEHSVPRIIRMYVSKGLFDQARIFFEKCHVQGGLSSKIYGAIMDAYAKKGLFAGLRTFELMERVGLKANEVVYGALINGFTEAGRTEEPLHYYRKVEERGGLPNAKTYNALVSLYAEAGNVDAALQWYWKIRNAGLFPDVVTYRVMLNMLGEKQLIQEVETVLMEMEKCHENCVPKIMNMYLSKGLLDQARIFFKKCPGLLSDAIRTNEQMERAGLKANEVVYGALINGFAEAGRAEEALHYYRNMKDQGIRANQIVLTSLLKACCKRGYFEGAKVIYESLKKFEGGPDIVAFNIMISFYASLGIISEAKVTFDNLRQKGQADGAICAAMMEAYSNMGMVNEAAEVAEEMRQSVLLTDHESYKGSEPDIVTYTYLVDCYGRANMVEGMKRIYGLMRFHKIEANESLYDAIMNAYRNVNRPDLAKLVSQEKRLRFGSNQYFQSDIESEQYSEY
ncbi:hypothetical protein Cgig2_024754 [Carnegiea gigantea]|uniref:Pentatricopeptide repeat-containing protein n=1 Tax=Carnegiea gigantea TaxID=171969 RepID=A0A9Q1QA85_9CARY|nr:hypothetical protein Cgig2_024754 [Carnegiea gigantea]